MRSEAVNTLYRLLIMSKDQSMTVRFWNFLFSDFLDFDYGIVLINFSAQWNGQWALSIKPLPLNEWFQNVENSVSWFVTGYECFQDPMSKTILTETLTSCDKWQITNCYMGPSRELARFPNPLATGSSIEEPEYQRASSVCERRQMAQYAKWASRGVAAPPVGSNPGLRALLQLRSL